MASSHQHVTAPDGRKVAFEVHGDPDGQPVLYLHGVPSSSREVHVFGLPVAARQAGAKLVTIDRPGIGYSDPRPGGTLLDIADDVAAVADVLGHQHFALLGYSAGSPSTLAAATRLADRVTTLGIVSGIAPGDRPDLTSGQADEVARLFGWARTHPRRLRAMLRGMQVAVHVPGLVAKAAAKGAPDADRAVLARTGAAKHFTAMLDAAFRQGIDGVAADFGLAAGPWPFAVEAIGLRTLIWHGEQDRNAPIAAARWLDTQLPDSVLHAHSDDGHASLLANHGESILNELTGH